MNDNVESFLNYSENKTNIKFKRKLLTCVINAEFNVIGNFLKDQKTKRAFFVREMHGISSMFNHDKDDDKYFLIFPKKKGVNLEIKDFMINNLNSNNILKDHFLLKGEMLYSKEWESYKKFVSRYIPITKENFNNKDSINIYSNKDNIINNNSNFLDNIISFYIDIKDNSTVIIDEMVYDLNESISSRFYDISVIFFNKLKKYFEKNFKIYICNESILINRNILQTFKFIMSRKIFYNKRFEIKDIQKFEDEINIYVDIRDKTFPDSVYQSRCHLLKLSDVSCFVSIISLIDVKYFSLNKRFNTLKAAIIVVLKLLKNNIEKELIQ
jgi:hypothetical protein